MLGHLRRCRCGQIIDLPTLGLALHIGRRQGRSALAATGRQVHLGPVRCVRLAQRRALVTGLPTRALAGPTTLAARPLRCRWLGRPIARRWFPAVAAVEAQSPLQCLHLLSQRLQLPRQLLMERLQPGVFGPQLRVFGLQLRQTLVPVRRTWLAVRSLHLHPADAGTARRERIGLLTTVRMPTTLLLLTGFPAESQVLRNSGHPGERFPWNHPASPLFSTHHPSTSGGSWAVTYFQRMHDVLLYYAKSDAAAFNVMYEPASESYQKRFGGKTQVLDPETRSRKLVIDQSTKGMPLRDVWNLSILAGFSQERVGYPTQKPLALLDRVCQSQLQRGRRGSKSLLRVRYNLPLRSCVGPTMDRHR